MRILSQDGKYDFPYERVCLEVSDSGKIFAQGDIWGISAEDNYIEIAAYESEAKARKAMEMLRNFNEVREVRNIPIKEVVIKTLFEPLKKLFEIYTYGEDEILKMNLVKVGDYFQLPSDDEVEA